MKKLYYLIILSLTTAFSSIAQNNSFADSFAVWKEFYFYLEDQENISYNERAYLMYGDTIISGKLYKNVYRPGITYQKLTTPTTPVQKYFSSGLNNKIGALRFEDKKVFFLALDNEVQVPIGIEYLLFDFGWTKGDTIFSVHHKTNDSFYHVITQDTIANGKKILRFSNNAHNSINAEYENVLIEGIGFTQSLFFRLKPITMFMETFNHNFGGIFGINQFCSDKNYYDRGSFGTSQSNTCQTTMEWALYAPENESKLFVTIYPNPATNHLTLNNLPENVTIILTDISGKTIRRVIVGNTWLSLDVSDLPNGIYFLSTTSETGTFTQKILKQ